MKYFRRKTQHLRQNFLFGFLAIGLFLVLPALTLAAPGDLDLSFGTGGKVFAPINLAPNTVRIQSDGKIVTLSNYPWDGISAISRHNPDGTADMTFGNGGYVLLYDSSQSLYDFVILPDGKLLCVGEYFVGGDTFAIFLFNSDGTLSGRVVTTVGGNRSTGLSIALQSDGKIIASGFRGTSSGTELVLVRYHPDLTLDTSFGTNGIVVETEPSSGHKIFVQPDGKLIVNGSEFIARYNSNGTPDNSFGTNGKVNIGFQYTGNMALQADGKIIINNNVSQSFSVIKRYNPNGAPDTAFGINGVVSITESLQETGFAEQLAIQKNGKILTAGKLRGTFAIARYNSNGTVDTTFGTNGLVITPLGHNNEYNRISALTLQPNGKIVAAGYFWNGSNGYATLVRYLSDPVNANFDFDGDARADISVFRPSDRVWYLNQSTNGFSAAQFGLSTDKITPADYDGDGKTDVAVFREGVWYLQRSTAGFTGIAFGDGNDIPQPADFDGDGKADLALWRPSNGTWFVLNLVNNQSNAFQFGASEDKPVVADYDGDGRADYAVFRPPNGTWYIQQSRDGFTAMQFGASEDKPVPADYDGDGKTDIAVFRPSNGTWYLQRSQLGFTGIAFGFGSDLPVPADYDGDGKADLAVFRNGTWYLQRSSQGFTGVAFGEATDKPAPNAFIP